MKNFQQEMEKKLKVLFSSNINKKISCEFEDTEEYEFDMT